MTLTDERRGQIALKMLKYQFQKDGVRLTPSFKRELGNAAKAIDVPKAEVFAFAELLVRELVNEAFADAPHADVQSDERDD